MKEELISFKTAKLAKEKGFKEPVYWHYCLENNKWELKGNSFLVREIDAVMQKDEGKNGIEVSVEGERLFRNYTWEDSKYLKKSECPFIAAPTQSLLQKWLREVHDIHIEIDLVDNSRTYYWEYVLITSKDRDYNDEDCFDSAKKHYNKDEFTIYEEALEKGLQEALKLI